MFCDGHSTMAPRALIKTVTRSDSVCKRLHNHNFEEQRKLLRKLSKKDLSSISDCFVGLVNQSKHFRVPPIDSEKLKAILKPHRRSIKSYVSKSKAGRYKSLQSGGFFSFLLTALLPVLAEIVTHLVKKYVLKE